MESQTSLVMNSTTEAVTDIISSNNMTDGITSIHPDYGCNTFTWVVYVFVLGGMCIFGLVGNTLSFLVLKRERRRAPVGTFLLMVMAVSDNLFLVTSGFSQIQTAIVLYYQIAVETLQAYTVVFVWPLVHISQMCTVWITVLIAFNRYIAICRPFQAPLLCTLTRVRIQVITIGIFIILYNIPRFVEYHITYHSDPYNTTTIKSSEPTWLKEDRSYNIIYENILYCLFIFLGPLVILGILNRGLIQELRAIRRRQKERHLPMQTDDEDNNLTLVMIVIVLIFLVCQTPAFVNQLLAYALPNSYVCGKPYYYYYHISNLLVCANSSVNFIVYCAFRRQFRQRLRAFFYRRSLPLERSNTYHYDGNTTTLYTKTNDETEL